MTLPDRTMMHQRGDASKGFVTHDYTVQHEDAAR
jgi:hypothetical protein